MKWKFKSIAALALSAAMVFSMTACGGESSSAASGAETSAATAEATDQHLNILLSGTVNNLDPNASS